MPVFWLPFKKTLPSAFKELYSPNLIEEYFLEIDVDNEIDKEILCDKAPVKSLGIYSTRFLDCQDADKQKEIDAFDNR